MTSKELIGKTIYEIYMSEKYLVFVVSKNASKVVAFGVYGDFGNFVDEYYMTTEEDNYRILSELKEELDRVYISEVSKRKSEIEEIKRIHSELDKLLKDIYE